MLNYIWLALIVIGIAVAVADDWHDLSTNRYHNGDEISVTLLFEELPAEGFQPGQSVAAALEISPKALSGPADLVAPGATIVQKIELIPGGDGTAAVSITPDGATPALWSEIASAQKKEKITGQLSWNPAGGVRSEARLVIDPVKFVRLNAVTNDGFIRYAKTAVELAIGLIGIMALWLGVMKIAEQSGLVSRIAAMVRPVTTRLFPDVPPDHPAMGAMIMNISANMLGLSNAATPLGLKAMEELNKLNTKLGTATDAMCTFLVINTSSVQLIPATVIALRSAAGSSNPTEILGPVIVATTVNTVVGVITVKLLARLPYFRKQLASAEVPA